MWMLRNTNTPSESQKCMGLLRVCHSVHVIASSGMIPGLSFCFGRREKPFRKKMRNLLVLCKGGGMPPLTAGKAQMAGPLI